MHNIFMDVDRILTRITIRPEQCGGRPCIRGMRIRVADVIDLLANGLSAEQVLVELPDLEARQHNAIILTKDADFSLLLNQLGQPPRVIWLTCGNTTNAILRDILVRHALELRAWIAGTEPLIEIR